MAIRRNLGTWQVCPACSGVGYTLHSCAAAPYLRPGGLPACEDTAFRVSGQGDLFYDPAYRGGPGRALRERERVGNLTADQAQAIEDTLQEAGLYS